MPTEERPRNGAIDSTVMDGARELARSLHELRKALVRISEFKDVQKMWLRTDKKAEERYNKLAETMVWANLEGRINDVMDSGTAFISSEHEDIKEYIRGWFGLGGDDRKTKMESRLSAVDEAHALTATLLERLKGFRKYASIPGSRDSDDFREMVDDMLNEIPALVDHVQSTVSRVDMFSQLGNGGARPAGQAGPSASR